MTSDSCASAAAGRTSKDMTDSNQSEARGGLQKLRELMSLAMSSSSILI